MKVTTTARHYELSSDLKEYAETKVTNLTTYFDNIVNAQIVFTLEKYRHVAEVTLHANGRDFASKQETDNMYTSVDRVVEKLERQILKYKGKLRNRKPSKKSTRAAETDESDTEDEADLVAEIYEEGEIIPADPIEFPTVTLDEAVAKLKENGKNFSIFSNSDTKRLNVIYLREDGTLGLIEA